MIKRAPQLTAPLLLMKFSFNFILKTGAGWLALGRAGGEGGRGGGALSQVPTEPPRKSDTLLMNMGVSELTGPGWALTSALG